MKGDEDGSGACYLGQFQYLKLSGDLEKGWEDLHSCPSETL